MSSKNRARAASPAPAAPRVSANSTAEGAPADPVFQPPARPPCLEKHMAGLFLALIIVQVFFAIQTEFMKDPVAKGMYRKRDGVVININNFNPIESGPYPKCHDRWKQYQLENKTWVAIDSAPSGGPYPVGHPENAEWKIKADDIMKTETRKNRFKWKGLQPSLHLLGLACLSVALGSKLGVWDFTNHGPESEQEESQIIQAEDAYLFPIIGSVALFSLYVVYKYIGSEWIKYGISLFITVMCVHGFSTNIESFGKFIGKRWKPLYQNKSWDVEIGPLYIAGFAVGGVMAFFYIQSKLWIVNNVFGISFCLTGIRKICLQSYQTGAIMLIGLFFYDVFWVFGSKSVFGSNVMVTVAKGVEAPIKLLFPRAIDGCGNIEFSMLGLGDIVVPGLFIAFIAKFDAIVQDQGRASSSVYFNIIMVAYVLSLITTVAVMLFFNAAQPALLYIVPYVLAASLLTAVARKEVKSIFSCVIPEGPAVATKEE